MLTVCQAVSLLALKFCQEKKMKSALGELEGGKTAAFNKMGERREAQHLDQGGKSEVREDTQLTYARSYRHSSPPQWHPVLHALDSDILDTCINLPDSRFFSPLHLRITGTKHFSFLFALLQEKL